ncbi:Alpha-tubulin N-acetyltransferase [Frankliniella fusca]|uniref:Alpha-tubulin N-acetyltransferase n=1 Tax=Frankliniella fusca TaxID=407009 RepID=A0AAE1I207_9NEOP|nr:Alpha-tubulin N-acetyltransferase [Frankliniella fusca]
MEFNFSVNALFKEKIVKVKNNLQLENYASDRRGDGDVVSKVSTVLDQMGIVSAKAQKLSVAITSAAKLRNTDHVVYVMTDPDGNKGHGTVVGILKVGSKKLFIYDLTGVQWEMEPLCVLDFYIHESKQRTGCGRLLFDYMLKDQGVSPNHLALDQPSESFLSFMCKHYGLDSIIPQINSFVIYDSFFEGRLDKGRGSSNHGAGSKNRTTVQSVKALSRSHEPTTPSYGRHSAKKAGSVMAEYMQDPSLMSQNGNRQNSLPTNQSPIKTNVNKMHAAEEINGSDSQAQIRPTSLPEKLSGPCSTAESSRPTGDQIDAPDVSDETAAQNGVGTLTPEEVPGKLDLKFHHTHLW